MQTTVAPFLMFQGNAGDAMSFYVSLFPDAKIVAGFKPIMPSFRGQLDEEEIVQLIAFLKSLKAGQTPRRTESADPPLSPILEKQEGKQP